MTRRLALIFALLATAVVPAVAAAAPGRVTLVRAAGTSGDLAWSRAHLWRMHGTTAWDPATTWVRRSAYALDPATAAAHPDWVLKDAASTPLYLGTSLAADFGNPAYRAWWIAQVTAQAAGTAGVYVDDVSMERRAYYADGYGASIRDPRTGLTMTEANWQRYMADFMVELRAALPGAEIVHDVVWYKGDARPDIQRELSAATAVALETPSTAGAAGTYGWETFAGLRRTPRGRRARRRPRRLRRRARRPPVRARRTRSCSTPGPWPSATTRGPRPTASGPATSLNLGAPAGSRSSWSGVWRRDFAQGLVLVNPPGNGPRPVIVGSGYVDLDGVVQTQLTLAPGTAIVLRKAPTATAPPPPPVPPVAPVATPTPEPAPAPGRPGKRPGKAKAHIAGAATPRNTRTTVSLARARVTGHVTGAVSGYTRVTVQRKRGNAWVTVRRAKDSVSKRGTFAGDITPLSRGTYRVMATFEGTGTARPSKSDYKVRSL